MKRIRHGMLPLLFPLAFGWSAAVAQPGGLNPILSSEGIASATSAAASLAGPDARLVFVGAAGNARVDNNGMPVDLRFTLDDGRSTAWACVFYSPSRKTRTTIAAIDIPGLGPQAMQVESPVPIPDGFTLPLNRSLPYSGSETILPRLLLDSTFVRYRAELPGAWPANASYHDPAGPDSLRLAPDFPLDAPLWQIVYGGAGDSAMVCYVSAGSGRVRSLRGSAVAAVPADGMRGDGARMRVERRGAHAVVWMDAPRRTGDADISLYDISGRIASGPYRCGIVDGEGRIELDLEPLPPGVYYCRAIGAGWSAVAGIVR
jgi:hypothetical protein